MGISVMENEFEFRKELESMWSDRVWNLTKALKKETTIGLGSLIHKREAERRVKEQYPRIAEYLGCGL